MSWLDRLLAALGIKTEESEVEDDADEADAFRLHENTVDGLVFVAPERRMARFRKSGNLLRFLLRRYPNPNRAATIWASLSPRQQDVVAWVCLGYSTDQIAARMYIVPSTVRSHLHVALQIAGLQTREQLCDMFAEWDFSAWDQAR